MLRFNLLPLKQALERREGRSIPWVELGRRAGLSKNTLYWLTAKNARQVNLDTLWALIRYARSQGVEITAGDLIEETKNGG